jgi:integrase
MGDELKKIHARYGLMWRIGVSSGLRISDVLGLRARDVKTKLVRLTEKKTGKKRAFDIEPGLRQEIRAYVRAEGLQPDDFLFYSRRTAKHKPMSRQWACSKIKKTGVYLGLFSIGAHSMRKIYAVNLFRAKNGDLEAVRRALNHKYQSTTLIYLKDLIQASASPPPNPALE